MKNNYGFLNKNSRTHLCYCITLENPLIVGDLSKDPISKILNDYKDIEIILNNYKLNITKFIYFNKLNIHNILYNSQEIIKLDSKDEKNSLSFYLYLSLLIEDNPDIINYEYSIDFIKDLNKQTEENNNEKYKQLIVSKIMLILLKNYKNLDGYDENDEKDLYEIEYKNQLVIYNRRNNILIKDLDIFHLTIEQLYIEIITILIKEDEFYDYNNVLNIVNQLDFENINITKIMLDKLNDIFNNEDLINNYIISNINDLNDIKKINFYFILLKYILKNSFYIYQIPFLLKIRKTLIKIIKTDINQLLSLDLDKTNNQKFENILKIFLDSEYYYLMYLNFKLREVLDYYKEFLFETKKEDINIIQQILDNKDNKNNKTIIEKYLEEYDKAKKFNKKLSIIKYIYDNMFNSKDNIKKENDFNKCVEIWENCEENIKLNDITKIDEEKRNMIYNYCTDINNKTILLKIFSENELQLFKENIKLLKIKEDNSSIHEEKIIFIQNEIKQSSNNNTSNHQNSNKESFINDDITKSIIVHPIMSDDDDDEVIDINNKNSIESYSECKTESIKNKIHFDSKNNNSLKTNSNYTKSNKSSDNSSSQEQIVNSNKNDKNDESKIIKAIEQMSLNSESSNSRRMSNSIISQKNFNFRQTKQYDDISDLIREGNSNEEEEENEDSLSLSFIKYVDNGIPKLFFPYSIKCNKFKIIEFCKVIGKHKFMVNFIKELNNGYYISGGKDLKLILYDQCFNKIVEINDFEDEIYNIYEPPHTVKKFDEIHIICFSKKKGFLFSIDNKTKYYKSILNFNEFINVNSCLEIKSNNYLFCSKSGCFPYFDPFNSTLYTEEHTYLNNCSYHSSIKINDNVAAITSNKIISNGENKLLFYDSNAQVFFYEIEGYSFTLSINGLALIPREKVKKRNKILLCACKKYYSNQKNGILFSKIDTEETEEGGKIFYSFYDTGNFEVYCFCPILIIENKKVNFINREEIKIQDTDYFFVGGFERNKSKGIIKLFKVINNDNLKHIKIEYLIDINIENNNNFKGFRKPINCIKQSTITGNIVITCLDRKVYLFSIPNMDYFLENAKRNRFEI